MSKQILFEDLAEQIDMLNETDRAEFAQFLVENYIHAAAALATDIGHAEMDLEYGAYDSFESYRLRDNVLT